MCASALLLAACSAAPEDSPGSDGSRAYANAASCAPEAAEATELTWIEVAHAKRELGATSLKFADDGTRLRVRVEGKTLNQGYQLYIDADGKWATGIHAGSWEVTGADYVVLGTDLQADLHVAEQGGWLTKAPPKKLRRTAITNGWELEIDKSALPLLDAKLDIGLGFLELNAAGDHVRPLPTSPSVGRRPPEWKGSGMIVPAYLEPNDSGWERLAGAPEGAAMPQTAKASGPGKEFWVVINGNDNGPYTTFQDVAAGESDHRYKWKDPAEAQKLYIEEATLTQVKLQWRNAKDGGAKLIAYVHACTKPTIDCGGLLPLEGVKAHVDKWLRHVPDLDGIWIDEFYPQHDWSTPFEGGQYAPEGGYYAELVRHIRGKEQELGKELLIVGNAGGRLLNDRLEYARLVDVLCSFEAAYEQIEVGVDPKTGLPWPGIARQTVRPRYGQLALIHNVLDAKTMGDVLERVWSEGYSHVFVTNRNHNANVWGGIPFYLDAQRALVASSKRSTAATSR